MRTILALAIAALLTFAGIVTWVTAAARSSNEADAHATSGNSIDAFELMKRAKDLPEQQFDSLI